MNQIARILVASVASLAFIPGAAVPAEAAMTVMSGTQSCGSGQTVQIQFWTNSRQTVSIYVDGRLVSTQTVDGVSVYNTGKQSAAWKITGSDLAQTRDLCSGILVNGIPNT